jgi:arsenate reductase (thioredoxin)
MNARSYHVLFLCTGNSARSILAESLLNYLGQGRFRAFSAGSYPEGVVNRLALELLRQEGLPITNLRSKSWDEYAPPGAPPIDFIFTVCDNAAGEACPVWPGKPTSAHWGIPDPAAVAGDESERRQAFRRAFDSLDARIQRLIALPLETLEPKKLKEALQEIGRTPP